MYKKIGHIRLLFLIFGGLALMGAFTYVRKNKVFIFYIFF